MNVFERDEKIRKQYNEQATEAFEKTYGPQDHYRTREQTRIAQNVAEHARRVDEHIRQSGHAPAYDGASTEDAQRAAKAFADGYNHYNQANAEYAARYEQPSPVAEANAASSDPELKQASKIEAQAAEIREQRAKRLERSRGVACARAWVTYDPHHGTQPWRQVVQFYTDEAGTEWNGERLDRNYVYRSTALGSLDEVVAETGVGRMVIEVNDWPGN